MMAQDTDSDALQALTFFIFIIYGAHKIPFWNKWTINLVATIDYFLAFSKTCIRLFSGSEAVFCSIATLKASSNS